VPFSFYMKQHEIKIRVRYQETDQMGIVYYANFFIYFEMGRTEYLRKCGLSYAELEKEHFFFPVAEAHCRYRSPAYYDDVLILETRLIELKHATIEFGYKVTREGDNILIAEGYTKLACLDGSRKPSILPEKLRKILKKNSN